MKSISRYVLCLLVLLFPVAAFAAGPHGAPPGLDGRFVQLAQQVPGFGGYFFDANGDLNVYLTDLSRADEARAAVAEVAIQRGPSPQRLLTRPAAIIVRHGDFDFLQLDEWHQQMRAAWSIPGVVSFDSNEATNRVVIGVSDMTVKPRVLALADSLGVPRNAIDFEFDQPPVPVTTLQQYYRPVVGGLQEDWSGTYCSVGVNLVYWNWSQNIQGESGFYTASHCSNTRFGTDSTVYSQGGYRIGQERYDPPTFNNSQYAGCPVNYACRWSDVTFVKYDSGVNQHRGYIAQTTSYGYGPYNSGSLTINSSQPEFQITNLALPVQGQVMNKVGRTTGWTAGTVANTCKDVPDGSYKLLCQDEVNAFVDGGDSGSPVFQYLSSTTVGFSGIAWARNFQGGLYYSNYSIIANDFGTGVTYTP